jgi:hypothetical protein
MTKQRAQSSLAAYVQEILAGEIREIEYIGPVPKPILGAVARGDDDKAQELLVDWLIDSDIPVRDVREALQARSVK